MAFPLRHSIMDSDAEFKNKSQKTPHMEGLVKGINFFPLYLLEETNDLAATFRVAGTI